MSNRRKPRKLRPGEVARQDQYLAEARQVGTQPKTCAIVVQYAEPGTPCSWCDCPDYAAAHTTPGGRCDGCPRPAAYIVHMMYGRPEQTSYPVCGQHQADIERYMAKVAGRVPEVAMYESPIQILDD